jgi:hypothetical protein
MYTKEQKDIAYKNCISRKFNMTVEEYDDLYRSQNGKCAICQTSQENLSKRLCLDHCHKSGKARQLLCGHCNRILGYFYENIDYIKNAIKYLEEDKTSLLELFDMALQENNESKSCPRCGEKDINKFKKNKRNKDGLNNWCTSCKNTYATQYRNKIKRGYLVNKHKKEGTICHICGETDLSKFHDCVKNRGVRCCCIKCDKARSRPKTEQVKILKRNRHLKITYGINLDQYRALYIFQQGKCAVCGVDEKNTSTKRLTVDHIHDESRIIRGLLCNSCNTGLGNARDNINILNSAIQYLQNNNTNCCSS